MQCNGCSLRYNLFQRSPYVLTCGHSICKKCLDKVTKCDSCQGSTNIAKINYSLLEILKKDKKNIDKFIKVCFIGSSGVGKTSLIAMLNGQSFQKQLPTTIGYDFSFIDRKIQNYYVRFQLWDSAGQQKYKAISPIHYKNADILIIVYDMNQTPKQNKVLYWLNQADKHCQSIPQIVIIGNKLDLVQQKVVKPIQDQVWKQIKENQYMHFQISCKCKINEQEIWNLLQNYFIKKSKEKKEKVDNKRGPLTLVKERKSKRQKVRQQCC